MERARQKSILMVEDEEALAKLVKVELEAAGFEVVVKGCGKAALGYAAERQVDLAILDVNLPDINGYQVARELRRLHHPWALPILMLTVRDKPIDQLRGFAHGADAYLTKPFHTGELVETVAMLCGEPASMSSFDEPSGD